MKSLPLCLFFFCLIHLGSSTLFDGIVTVSWLPFERIQLVDRFLSNQTQIQLKILCREPTLNATVTKEQIKKKLYQLDKKVTGTTIKITGRIGRVTGCLPLQPNAFSGSSQSGQDDQTIQRDYWRSYYDRLWKEMEIKTFSAHQSDCDYTGTHLYIDQLSDIIPSEYSKKEVMKFRQEDLQTARKTIKTKSKNDQRQNRRRRRRVGQSSSVDENNNVGSSPLLMGLRATTGTIVTWGDGYYLIEINAPEIESSNTNGAFDVDVIISMKNRHDGYISADEYPALVFYGLMCGIYALFALLWFIWCAFYWKELLKIQFWIGGVILIGMIEKSAFVAEYDTLNRNGYKVHYAIVTAEILSCLKRTVSRMLVIIVALGYGLVKPRLGPLKQKVLAMGFIYFVASTIEAMVRLNTKNDETNNNVLISRLPVAIIDAMIYYWIFTGLAATIRLLRLKNNAVKLHVYQYFTNTMLLAIVSSVLFMIWSLKSRFFTTCITNWNEFWIDDAFWHILFSLILLVIMFLFRPSNNNQRYAFIPLLDHSDKEEFTDDDENENNETALFDSVTIRKNISSDSNSNGKTKKSNQNANNETVDETLDWIENNIPTSIADQALKALDSEDEIVNTKLERSKMQ